MRQFLNFIVFLLPCFVYSQHKKINISEKTNSTTTYLLMPQDTLGIYDRDLLPASFHLDRRKAVRAFMPEKSMSVFCMNNTASNNTIFFC